MKKYEEHLIKQILKRLGEEYSVRLNKTLVGLNSGDCEDIAYDVINGLDIVGLTLMDDGLFWSIDPISKYKTLDGEYWNINNFRLYGEPPISYDKLNITLKGHVWVYYAGKHYDVETIDGVDNFWHLPIFERQLLAYENWKIGKS